MEAMAQGALAVELLAERQVGLLLLGRQGAEGEGGRRKGCQEGGPGSAEGLVSCSKLHQSDSCLCGPLR